MRILVTGGGGFVGSVLVRRLLGMGGVKVRVLDNLFRPAPHLVQLCGNPDFEFHCGDVTSIEDVQKAVKDVDAIIHLAALVGEPICNRYKALCMDVNYGGTRKLIENIDKNVQFYFASTGSVYGDLGNSLCTELSPLKPISGYARSKVYAEELVEEFGGTIFRFSTAAGVSYNPRLNLLPNDFTWQAVNNKSLVVFQADFKRSFVDVDDMAWAFQYALANWDLVEPGVYNVGHPDANWTKRELAEYIKSKTGCAVFYGDGYTDPDQRNYSISFDKILATGWKPKHTLENSIDALIKSSSILSHKPKFD